MNEKIEPRLVGGLGEKDFGSQYKQGNRVYDSNSIAMCILSQPVGHAGGYSYLYLVENKTETSLSGGGGAAVIRLSIRLFVKKEQTRDSDFSKMDVAEHLEQ